MRRSMIVADMIVADSLNNKVQKPKTVTSPPPPDKDTTWQKRMTDSLRNKAQPKSQENKPGLFTQNPGKIANDLKMQNPTDYGKAQRKLTNQINRQGRNLSLERKNKLWDAKDALRDAYGIHDDNGVEKNDGTETEVNSIAEQSIYALPPGHNLDDATVDTMGVVPDDREKILPPVQAHARLKASIQNTTQNPSTRMSSVQDFDGGSTSVDNLDEHLFGMGSPTGLGHGATFDSLDTAFEDVEAPQKSAYADAGKALEKALGSRVLNLYVDVS